MNIFDALIDWEARLRIARAARRFGAQRALQEHARACRARAIHRFKAEGIIRVLVAGFAALLIASACFAQASSPIVQVEPSAIPAALRDQWIFYQSADRGWRWRRVSSNWKIVGASSESYKRLRSCQNNARRNGWSRTQRNTLVVPYK